MKAVGVIAEYNPFHNGHRFHLHEVREQTGADYTVAVMSGNFTQRGAPALIHKYVRTRMALLNGADLVLELPLYYACGSAEYFSRGAVSLLDKIGIISDLGFGSECGRIDWITQMADLLNTEPPSYQNALKSCLRSGLTYPQARAQAIFQVYPEYETYRELLTSPNNILGIEYCRALMSRGSLIQPMTIKRVGSDYHDVNITKQNNSALALRISLQKSNDPTMFLGQVPDNVYPLLAQEFGQTFPLFDTSLSALLHYKLLLNQQNGYTAFADVTQELSDRILNHLNEYTCSLEFCNLLKTKDMTYTRISRCLLHILLDMTKENLDSYINMDYTPYARILGFRRDAKELLSALKKNSSIPLLSKLADASSLLSKSEYSMLLQDIQAAHIYNAMVTNAYGTVLKNEFSQEIVIL